MKKLYNLFCDLCAGIIAPVVNVWARIYIGLIFFRSGQAKFSDLEETVENFDPEEDGDFVLSFLPDSIPPEIPAYMATFGELILPALLFVGLFTRISAIGLFIMAAVIQFFVLQDHQHYFWMIILALLVGHGGGKLSVDYWLLKERK